MKVQIWHSRGEYNFTAKLYEPIKKASFFSFHTFIFPHDASIQVFSEETLKEIDVFIAEISYPSTGLWIELWIAKMLWKRIVWIYKKGTVPSSSIDLVTQEKYEYSTISELLEIIERIVNS